MSVIDKISVSINRNLKGLAFPGSLSDEDTEKLSENTERLINIFNIDNDNVLELSSLSKIEQNALIEERYLTKKILKNPGSKIIFPDENTRIIVNGEDHWNIIFENKEKSIFKAYEDAVKIEKILDDNFEFEFNEKYGYLTSNVYKCGSGIYPCALLHLPALSQTEDIIYLILAAEKCGVEIKLFENRNDNPSNLYYIFPKNSLDEDFSYNVKLVNTVINEIEDTENKVRKSIINNDNKEIINEVNEAANNLLNVTEIAEEDMLWYFSNFYLGIELGLIKNVKEGFLEDYSYFNTVNNFKDAHIELEKNRKFTKKDLDRIRADKIKDFMEGVF